MVTSGPIDAREPESQTSLSDLVPNEEAQKFLRDPRGWVATLIVMWILDLWRFVLTSIEGVFGALAEVPRVAFLEPLVLTFSPAGQSITRAYTSFGNTVMDIAATAGIFAPIVTVVAWFVPLLLLAIALQVLVGFFSTYLPLKSIPVIGRYL